VPAGDKSPGDAGGTGIAGLCARHPQTRALLTCSRCGDFACAACAAATAPERLLCKRCEGIDYERLRKGLGPHERRVRAIALYLWLIGSIVGVTLSMPSIRMLAGGIPETGVEAAWSIATVVAVPFCALSCVGAFYLQRFTKTGRVLGAILAALSVSSVPIGTLLGTYMAWVLLGRKGQAVFTPTYRAAIVATPHLKYGISIGTKVLVALLGGFFLLLLLMMLETLVGL
jgi:hypothetical protein